MKEDLLFIDQIPVGNYKNFAYIVADRSTNDAAIFDPAWDVPRLLAELRERNLKLRYIVNTHAHFDHIEGNQKLREATQAKIVLSDKSTIKKKIAVSDGEVLKLGNLSLRFIQTPGHSPESMCIIIDDRALITGDTLFIDECGRVDTPGGSAEELFESFRKIRNLDPTLVVYPGHDYGKKKSSTLKEQFEYNYTLAKRTKEEFVRFMSEP